MSEVLDQSERDRTVNVNTVQNANCATADNRNEKASPRQGSPAPRNSSAGSASSRTSSPARTVRFQDQVESGYGASGKGRWQSPQVATTQRTTGQRPQGQSPPSPWPPSPSQSGPRFPPPQSERQWTRQVKVPRAYVRRPHSIQEIGGRDGDHPPLIIIDRRQFSRRVRQHSDAGIRMLKTNSRQMKLTFSRRDT